MGKKALITGITGQDGSYLAELLLSKGYEVHGIIRRASTFNTSRLEHLYTDPHTRKAPLKLHYGDLSDASALARLVGRITPDEIYNLASQSHVRVSFDSPEYTTDITATGAVRLLEAIREPGIKPHANPRLDELRKCYKGVEIFFGKVKAGTSGGVGKTWERASATFPKEDLSDMGKDLWAKVEFIVIHIVAP